MKIHLTWAIAMTAAVLVIVAGFVIATVYSSAQQTEQKLACFASHGSWTVDKDSNTEVCVLKAATNG